MIIWTALLLVTVLLAVVPALVFYANLRAYLPPPGPQLSQPLPAVSVLIPARNEEATIAQAVNAALQNHDVKLEVIVLDDHSSDETAAIVGRIAETDDRVRLVPAAPLPPGWCGKQHACWQLAQEAQHPLLVFIDADVTLAEYSLARMASFMETSGADLGSGIPRQRTGTFLEILLIPLIHFVMLCYLSIPQMRRSRRPALSAGCGQLFIARAAAYHHCGGHSAIRASLHDGIKLPRWFRACGLRTDLFDATKIASCRMYRNGMDVWLGLAKNAGEGLAAPRMIVPITGLLLFGQVMPFVWMILAVVGWPAPWPWHLALLAVVAVAAAIYPRWVSVGRFRQPILGAILHPLGILVLLAIQWFAFLRDLRGRPAVWKGRSYPLAAEANSPKLPPSAELERSGQVVR